MIIKNQTFSTLLNVAIILPVSFLVAKLVDASHFENIGVGYGLTVGLITGVILTIDLIVAETAALLARWNAIKTLKKHGYKSVEDAEKDLLDLNQYTVKIQSLPYESQQEIVDKARRTDELIKDYESRPDFYFQNMSMTKQEAIKQVRTDFNNWMKQKGFPTWTPRNLQ